MRQAARQNPGKRPTAVGKSLPAPVGGWDAKNPLAKMPIQNAVILDNWIPRGGWVELRRGYVSHQSGIGPVESIFAYRGGTTDVLFAASAGHIYDVTTAGGTPSSVHAGSTSNRWNDIAFSNAGGAWLILLNGTDLPLGYNAGTWANLPAITGIADPTKLFNGFAHKSRLYYLEKDSLRVWNPAALAVGGACTELDLSPIFSKGGRLICGANWSGQMGLTADDFAVFMTDQGQVAVYQITDPTVAADITLLGVFDLGPPLGPKALTKWGGDLAVLTADGVVPLSQGLKLDRSQENQVALTNRIMNAFSAAVRAYSANFGWQGILYPSTTQATDPDSVGGSLAIFNVPVTSLGTSYQFVQNVLTGGWCRFLGLDAYCWALAGGNIYFGASDGVYQWDKGSSDNGDTITGDVKTAFTDFGLGGLNKRFTLIRPTLNTNPEVKPALEVDVDYQESIPVAVPTVVTQGETTPMIRYDWTGASGVGFVGAARMQVVLGADTAQPILAIGDIPPHDLAINGGGDGLLTTTGLPFDVTCQLYGFDVVYERGGVL